MTTLLIRNLRPVEVELQTADTLLMAAFGSRESRLVELRRYLALQPDGWFVAWRGDQAAGMCGAIRYATFAYIGLVGVQPGMRHRGVARTLMTHVLDELDRHGIPLVQLDATGMGRPLYLSLGFHDYGVTGIFRQEQWVRPGPPDAPLETLAAADLPALAAFDAPIFGANRLNVLQAFWKDYPTRLLVTRDAQGQFTGYLFATRRLLGPWAAANPQDAERLLCAALRLPWEEIPCAITSSENPAAPDLLRRYGFELIRTEQHMLRGALQIPGQRQYLYGQASLAIG